MVIGSREIDDHPRDFVQKLRIPKLAMLGKIMINLFSHKAMSEFQGPLWGFQDSGTATVEVARPVACWTWADDFWGWAKIYDTLL